MVKKKRLYGILKFMETKNVKRGKAKEWLKKD